MTISDLLDELGDPHPYAVVRINQTYVSRPDFNRTTIPDDAEVFLIPMIAGG
jgi:sulfur carrier protein ThiS